MPDESDIDRTKRLCSEAAEFCTEVIIKIPANTERPKMNFHQKFHHDFPGKLILIGAMLRVRAGRETPWEKVQSLSRRLKFDMNTVFTAFANEFCGYDVVSAMMLIQAYKSDELEIDADRRTWEAGGEGALQLYDTLRKAVDAQEAEMIELLHPDLRPIWNAKRRVDEIGQIAKRNMSREAALGL